MKDIGFTSLIQPTAIYKMRKLAEGARFVNEPWTTKEITKACKVATEGIYDCSAGGITDGRQVVMFHLNPQKVSNLDKKNLEQSIVEKLDLNKSLRGFLVGSNRIYDDSLELFDNLQNLMEKYKIPFSKLRGQNFMNADIMYDGRKDIWYFTNPIIHNASYGKNNNLGEFFKKFVFDEIKIDKGDELALNILC